VIKQIKILLTSLFVLLSYSTYAQSDVDEKLAAQYFQEKDFAKAAELYQKLYENKPTIFYYRQYTNCLFELGDLKTAEKFIKKELKKNPDDANMNVDVGYIYQLNGEDNKANKHYSSIINELKPDKNQINNTANAFVARGLYSKALETYKKGRELLKDQYNFGLEIANILYIQNNFQEMVEEYLNMIDINYITYINFVQQRLQDFLSQDPDASRSSLVKNAILNRIKKYPDKTFYTEMLLWLLIQQKDFSAALLQAKSLDRRLNEDGARILNIARLSSANKDYEVAIEAYNYILSKGKNSIYYYDCRIELINTRYLKITESLNYTKDDLLQLEKEYNLAIQEIGNNTNTISLIKNLAHLEAFYLNNDSIAKKILKEAIALRDIKPIDRAECKLELADIYLMSGEIWEATLLYSQVEKDKAFKNEPIGHLAKFKNAKLSYYISEFEWAKAQLDVLKGATSKLIANDAMELSLFIADNIDPVDSSTTALEMFARADLNYFRNNKNAALMTLDSIIKIFSYHPITDDVYFKKAQIYMIMNNYKEADSLFSLILQNYSYDILADDALYNKALINEEIYKNKETAMELYQELLMKYPGSIYCIDARKRYRQLRGDIIN